MKQKILISGLIFTFVIFGFGANQASAEYGYPNYGTQPSYPSSYNYSNMRIGSRGPEVANLQMFLVSKGFLYMPPGASYGYFGPQTQNALYRYQQSIGSYPGYGNIYPTYPNSTGARCPSGFSLTTYNGVYGCWLFPSGVNNNYNYPNYNYDYDRDDDRDTDDLQGDGDFSEFELREGDDSDTEEGDNDAEIAEIRFDVEDGDVQLDRVQIDLELTSGNNSEGEPWNVFENIRLLLDGEEIDDIDADDEDEWSDEGDDTYRLIFSNIDEILEEGDDIRLTLEADISNDIDFDNNDDEITFELSVPDRGIRGENSDDDTVDIGDDSDSIEIRIDR